MKSSEPLKIEKPFLILCEGTDAKRFLIPMLNSDAFADDPRFSEEIQVMDFGGIKDLTNYLKLLSVSENYSKVRAIMVIRDAETDGNAASESIKKSFAAMGLSIPENPATWTGETPAVSYLLFPSCDGSIENGTLEDFCISILSESQWDHMEKDIGSFLDSFSKDYGINYPRKFKNMLHTYFSTSDDFVGLKIGEAAKAHAFDWENEKITGIKEFLRIGLDLVGL